MHACVLIISQDKANVYSTLSNLFKNIYIFFNRVLQTQKKTRKTKQTNQKIKKKKRKKKDYFPNGESNPGLAGKLSNFNQPESGRC